MSERKPTYKELEKKLAGVERKAENAAVLEARLKKMERQFTKLINERNEKGRTISAIRSTLAMPELYLDQDWKIVGYSGSFPFLTGKVVEFARKRKNLGLFLKDGDFDRIKQYLSKVELLKKLPYNQGGKWRLRYQGPKAGEKIGKNWIEYEASQQNRWKIEEERGRLKITHLPHIKDEQDCYLMTVEQFGGADEDVKIVYKVRTSSKEENIRDLSLVISGGSGTQETLPDLVGYTVCSASFCNTQARIQRQTTDIREVQEALEPDTEYQITVERIGGRIRRLLRNTRTGKQAPELEAIDTNAIYDRWNHLGFTTYAGEVEIYDVKIYTRKSRFTIDTFRIPFEVNVGIRDRELDNRTFKLRLGRESSEGKSLNILMFEDLTEHVRIEKELENERATLNSIINLNPYSISIYDSRGHYLRGNQAFQDLFKQPPPEDYSLFNDPILEKAGYSEELARLKEGEVVRLPALWYNPHLIKPDLEDSPVFVRGLGFPILDPDGSVEYLVAVHEDITEHKQAEEALRRSEERYRVVAESAFIGLGTSDEKEFLTYVNPAFANMLGYSSEELTGMNLSGLMDPEAYEMSRSMTRLRMKGIKNSYEIILHRRDGTPVNVLVSAAPLTDADGRYKETLAAILDITERKKAEEALLQSKERFRELAELLPEIVFEMDGRGFLTFVNRQAFEISGYTREDINRGFRGVNMLVPADRKRALLNIQKIMKGETAGTNEYTARRKDGETFPVIIRSRLVLRDGKPVGLRGIVFDISERKRAEKQLMQYRDHLEELVAKRTGELTKANQELQREILERRKAEEALQRAADIYDSIQVGLYIVRLEDANDDRSFRIIDANRASAEITGIPLKDIVGKTLDESFPRLRGMGFFQQYVDAARSARPVELDDFYYGDDRVEWNWFRAKAFPLPNNCMGMAFENVTGRKKTEEALRYSEERYRTLVETAPHGIEEVDTSGVITFANSACHQIYGYEDGELIGKEILSLCAADSDREKLRSLLETLIKEQPERLPSYERHITKQGKLVDIQVDWNYKRDNQGRVTGFISVLTDITDRKRAEEALRVSEREKALILDNISEQLMYLDRDMKILWTNRASYELLGITHEQLVGRYCYELWHQRNKPCKDCPVKLAGETGEPHEGETNTPEGRILHIRGYPVKEETGEVVGVVEVTQDITERRKAEEELQEYKKAVESSEDMITSLDGNYVYLFVNKAFLDYHCLSRDQVVGRSAGEVLGKEIFEEKIKPGLDRSLQNKVSVSNVEYRFPEIGIRTLEMSSYPLKGIDGKITGVVSVGRDVTELKKAEEALRYRVELEKLLATISTHFINLSLDNLDKGIKSALQQIGKFAAVDRSYLVLFSEGGAIMENTHEWCAESIEPQIGRLRGLPVELLPRWMEEQKRVEVIHLPLVAGLSREKKYARHEQEKISGIVVPMVLGKSLIGFLGFDTVRRTKIWIEEDITLLKMVGEIFINALERKRAENALRESEEKFRNFLDNLGDVAYQTDEKGNITYTNRMVEKLTGLPLEEVVGKSFLPLFTPESEKVAAGVYQRTLQGESPEYELIFTNGKIGHFKNEPLRDQTGKIIGVFGTARDITERKLAEEALRQSEEKYRDLVENINDVLVVIDSRATITYISQVIESLGGYSTSEIIDRPFQDFIYREDLGKVEEAFRKVFEQTIEPVEFRIVTKTGDLLWMYINGRPVLRDGRVIGFQGMMTDITERKKAEVALRESEERFRGIFENIRDIYYRADLDGKLTLVNPLAAGIMGYESSEELTGENIAGRFYFDRDKKDLFREELEKHGEVKNREITLKRKDGSPIVVEVSTHYIYDETGRPVAIEGLGRDITERKKAEIELKKARDELELRVVERTAALLNSEQQLQERLRELTCLFQIRQEFDSGASLGKTLIRCSEHIRQALSEPERKGAVIVLDGHQLAVNEKFMPSDNCLEVPLIISNRKRGCLRVYCYASGKKHLPFEEDLVKEAGATLSSFIQNRELQAQLVQTEKLAATGRVAAGVAHEINTPLGAIRNSLYILKDAIPADHKDYFYLGLMDSEIARVAGIIFQLYDLYKPASRKTQPVKLCTVVGNVLKMMQTKIDRREIIVHDNMDRSIPKLNTSVNQLTQVLYNIIENSVQAMPDGGILKISSEKSVGKVELAISDTGPGIPDEVVPHIFEPFFTTKGLSNASGEGMGMGLSLARSIMESLGGRVSVRTAQGKGTTFILDFPTE